MLNSSREKKQDRETTKEPSTANAINAITAVEPLDELVINNISTTLISTTIPKLDANRTTVFVLKKENEVSNEANIGSTSDTVIEGKNFPSVQIVQVKDEQERETIVEILTATVMIVN